MARRHPPVTAVRRRRGGLTDGYALPAREEGDLVDQVLPEREAPAGEVADVSRTRDPEEYAERIQEGIVHCFNCQPFEDGECIWVRGRRTSLSDLFNEYRVPEKLWEEVARRLRCPSCGHSEMDWREDVGTKFDYEYAHEELIDRAEGRYGARLDEFSRFLREFPYLGVTHPVGRALFKQIKVLPHWTIADETWFRARRVQSGGRLTTSDMVPPDPRKVQVPEGRYNHAGRAYWYLASTDYAAAAEVVAPGERMAWAQRFRIPELTDVLDVRAWSAGEWRASTESGEPKDFPLLAIGLIFSEALKEEVARDATWKPEYLVPRFIPDAAKNQGYQGIIFNSPRHHNDNLVVFDRTLPFEAIGEPEIYTLPKWFEEGGEDDFFLSLFPDPFAAPGASSQ